MVRAEEEVRVPGLVSAVVARLPVILAEVRDVLVVDHPDYAGFLGGGFDEVVGAAEGFVARLVGLALRDPVVMGPVLASGVERAMFEEIGRVHCREQRDVTELLTAYRCGAAVAWRHVAAVALGIGVSAELFAGLATAVFTAVDQLSSASLRGYAREQSSSWHARERLRDELAELLLSERSGLAAVEAAAVRAGWVVPRQAAVVMVDSDNEVGRGLLARLDDSCLRLRRPGVLVAIVPDPSGPGRRARLATVLRGAGAVVGASVGLVWLPASVHLAELGVRLRAARVLCDDPLFVDEHLDAMVVHRDDRLLGALRAQYLAPLAGLSGSARERLAETLTSWLMNMGNRKAVAGELHVHPQTVRYRLGRLRELFGSALDDPAARATLLLALAWGPPATEPDPTA
ncbi:MAG: helix-turn-helix domain-containing protein, partial [Pseudonocardiaceae bacterium]